jgi:hypothetical protein
MINGEEVNAFLSGTGNDATSIEHRTIHFKTKQEKEINNKAYK